MKLKQKTGISNMEQEKINQYIETQKIVFDYIKHITTLDTGSIVLLSTLLENIFPNANWKPLIVVVFAGFSISIGSLTLCGFGIIRSIRTPESIGTGLVRFTTYTFILGLLAFLVGLVSLAIFTILNLF
jgi:hypothetical protein